MVEVFQTNFKGPNLELASATGNDIARIRLPSTIVQVGQRLVRSLDWLGRYTPALEYWAKQGLRIERVELGLGTTDPIPHRIQVSYQCPEAGKRIYGYGESERELFAYEKAIAELLEREALFLRGIRLGIKTTNGLAAHRLTFLAKQAAKTELQERDAFLRHWLTRTPLLRIPYPDDALLKKFRKAIEAAGYELILTTTYLGSIPSVIAVIRNPVTGGFLIGSSAARSVRASTRKAVGEAFLSLHSRRTTDALNWERPDFDTHANHWFFHNSTPSWFLSERKANLPKPTVAGLQFYILRREPIPVVAAVSPDLIDLWTGATPLTVTEKIGATYGRSANTDPHPFP